MALGVGHRAARRAARPRCVGIGDELRVEQVVVGGPVLRCGHGVLQLTRQISSSVPRPVSGRRPWVTRRQVAERDVLVDPRLTGEAEHPLADDVALDLVGAAADGDHERRGDHLERPIVEQGVVAGQHPVRPLDVERGTAEAVQVERGRELLDRHHRGGVPPAPACALGGGLDAQRRTRATSGAM